MKLLKRVILAYSDWGRGGGIEKRGSFLRGFWTLGKKCVHFSDQFFSMVTPSK